MTKKTLTESERLAWKASYLAFSRMIRKVETDMEAEGCGTYGDYDVLYCLYKSPEKRSRLSDLAREVTISPSGLTRQVDRLVKQGWVERLHGEEDRREVYAVLTPSGEAQMNRGWEIYADSIARYFVANTNEGEREGIRNASEKILAGLETPEVKTV
ncbi:MAG: MarR family transcriptional regulator [Chthonomonadaceae bacterium]|nr:MarR family transcriptional regulator [Chthonomonadaceae bacterium]